MITRRSMIASGSLFLLSGTFGFVRPSRSSSISSLTLYGPPAGPSTILACLAERRGLGAPAQTNVGFDVYTNPDVLRANVISGNWQVAIAPSYVAANLANKGLPIHLLNIMSRGMLYLLSYDQSISNPKDLAGETIGMFFRNDMPDLVFAKVMATNGLTRGKDYQLRYTGSPIEALQLLLSGRIKHCVLPEPAATAALDKAKKLGRTIHRAIDLAKSWSGISGSDTGQPLAGLMIRKDLLDRDPDFVDALHSACIKGADWVNANPTEAATIASEYMPIPAKIIARSTPTTRLVVQRAREIRPDLESFFSILAEQNPAIIGGELPPQSFYL